MEHFGGKVSIQRKVFGEVNPSHYHLAIVAYPVIQDFSEATTTGLGQYLEVSSAHFITSIGR